MKIVKSKAYKDRLRGHKESVITLYYPQGMGELLYSFSKDGFIRGTCYFNSVWDLDKRVITNKFVLSRNPELELPNEQENFKEEQGENKEEKQ